jgi:flagellar biosynthesis chaperone FliJ
MSDQRTNGHTVSRLTVHNCMEKYRYSTLEGNVVKKLKGRSSREFQQEFPN